MTPILIVFGVVLVVLVAFMALGVYELISLLVWRFRR